MINLAKIKSRFWGFLASRLAAQLVVPMNQGGMTTNQLLAFLNDSGFYQNQALTLSAYYRGLAYISESLMGLPWEVFEKREDNVKIPVSNQLERLLNRNPNPQITANVWRETMVWEAIDEGNSYAEIVFDSRGAVSALGHPIERGRTHQERNRDGEIWYRISPPSDLPQIGTVWLPQRRIFHLRGKGNPFKGIATRDYAKRTTDIGVAQENNVDSFFKNGSRTSGVLEHPGALTPDKRDELSNHLQKSLTGNSAYNVLVLQRGEKWQSLGMTSEESQTQQARQHTVIEFARWLGLPPHILMDYGRATWSNLEQASTEVVRSGLMPWAIRMEMEANQKLIPDSRRSNLITKINLDGLMRADLKTSVEAYAIGVDRGWWSPEDIRQKMDETPVDGLNYYRVPMNMDIIVGGNRQAQNLARNMRDIEQEHDAVLEFHADSGPSAEGRDKIRLVAYQMFYNAWTDVLSRESNQFQSCRQREDFAQWAENWINNKHVPYIDLKVKQVLENLCILSGKDAHSMDGPNLSTKIDAYRIDLIGLTRDIDENVIAQRKAQAESLAESWTEFIVNEQLQM